MVSTASAEPGLFRASISSKTFLYKKYIPLSSSRPLWSIFEDTKPGKRKQLSNLNGIDGTHLVKSLRTSQNSLLVWYREFCPKDWTCGVGELEGRGTKVLTQCLWTYCAGKPVSGGDVLEISAWGFFCLGTHLFDLEVSRATTVTSKH